MCIYIYIYVHIHSHARRQTLRAWGRLMHAETDAAKRQPWPRALTRGRLVQHLPFLKSLGDSWTAQPEQVLKCSLTK